MFSHALSACRSDKKIVLTDLAHLLQNTLACSAINGVGYGNWNCGITPFGCQTQLAQLDGLLSFHSGGIGNSVDRALIGR